ncbi:MAG: glycerophosphodiester phosphodiesterase, partial [Mycobacterium leprae]
MWTAILLFGLAVVVRLRSIRQRPGKPYLADERPVIMGHQGASAYAPSNTLQAFEMALAQGVDILELDVHLTRDGVVVVSHDETIDRMSNGHGLIKDLTLAEIRQYDFGWSFSPDGGRTFPYRGRGVFMPTLAEVFRRFPRVRVNIEVKQADPPMAVPLWEVIREHSMTQRVLIVSVFSQPLQALSQLSAGQLALGGTKANMIEFAVYWLLHLDWLYSPRVDAFQLPVAQPVGPFTIRLDVPRLVNRAHRLGVKVHYWTVNDEPTIRRLLDIGADGIMSDYPDKAVRVLREK